MNQKTEKIIFNGQTFWFWTDESKDRHSKLKRKYDFTDFKIGQSIIVDVTPEMFEQTRHYIGGSRKSEALHRATNMRNCIVNYSKKHNLNWKVSIRAIKNESDENIGYEVVRIK